MSDGSAYKIPRMNFPQRSKPGGGSGTRTVLFMNMRGYNNTETIDVVEAALASVSTLSSTTRTSLGGSYRVALQHMVLVLYYRAAL